MCKLYTLNEKKNESLNLFSIKVHVSCVYSGNFYWQLVLCATRSCGHKYKYSRGGQLLLYSTELYITLIILSRIIKMFLCLSQVLEFIESTPNSRNCVEEEKIINAGHLIFSGLNNQSVNQHNILSYCLQSPAFRDKPHEIKTIIDKNFKIVSSKYSCTAGFSERCKQVTAVLLFCTR